MYRTKIGFLTFAENPLDIKNLQAKYFFFIKGKSHMRRLLLTLRNNTLESWQFHFLLATEQSKA